MRDLVCSVAGERFVAGAGGKDGSRAEGYAG